MGSQVAPDHRLALAQPVLVVARIGLFDAHAFYLECWGDEAVLRRPGGGNNGQTVDALVRLKLGVHYRQVRRQRFSQGLTLAGQGIPPDLILLDISLPGMDGFQVFDALRQDKATESIPVVALTAKAMKGDREAILLHGFDGYLSKPVDAELLEETLRRFFHGE